ncbi:SipW-dependent-type signal peptide-containing protein [Halosolutus amylolyticus]|uniref:SipW-dependent-type signal peptide-containing protein n=2 Tax=Halosolutus amylolyticus TaxID=2932267 RepID=A0ABD5PN11_9EURY
MTEQPNSNPVSRRNVLGALGAIGVGGALAGAGTSAFFSDKETFEGNELVAGELDLKLDWEEHYSDWSEDELKDVGDWSMEPGDGLFGFPSTAPTAEQSVFVENEQQFMKNTAIEAFPDQTKTTNVETAIEKDHYDAQRQDLDDEICDLKADLDYVLSHPYRTRGTFGGDPNPQTTKPGDPLINISDVKPGDFGELTLSFHLCGNPGYVWLTGNLVDANENGHTEPERKDPDEITDDDPDVDGEYVELLDEIRASFWYDTGIDGEYGADLDDKDLGEGSNIFATTGESLLPLSGSLRSVLRALENEMFLLDPKPVSNGEDKNGGNDGDTVRKVSGWIDEDTDGIDETIVTGTNDRFGGARNYQCADYEERLERFEPGNIVGSEVLNPDNAPIEPGMEYGGCTTITVDSVDPDDENGNITLSSDGPVIIVSVKGGPNGEQVYVFDEPVVLDGAEFTTPGDHGISNVDVCCLLDGDDGDNGHDNGKRRCFENSTTAYIGFEWWLPVDHANEIQGDSVAFDIGFYTEQCRHNDGSGMDREEKSDQPT